MSPNSRTRRSVVRERGRQTRFTASLKRGRSLATHLIAAGVDAETAKGVATALRTVAKRLGVEPVKVDRTRRTVEGRNGRLRPVNHFTSVQVALLVSQYKPRKAEYKMAKLALAA